MRLSFWRFGVKVWRNNQWEYLADREANPISEPPAPESLAGLLAAAYSCEASDAVLAEAIDALTVEAKSKARVHDAALNFAARDRHEQAKRIETLEAATSSARSAAHEEDHLNELADARDAAQ